MKRAERKMPVEDKMYVVPIAAKTFNDYFHLDRGFPYMGLVSVPQEYRLREIIVGEEMLYFILLPDSVPVLTREEMISLPRVVIHPDVSRARVYDDED